MSEHSLDAFGEDVEMRVMASIFTSLKVLESDAQARVIDYVVRRLGLNSVNAGDFPRATRFSDDNRDEKESYSSENEVETESRPPQQHTPLDGGADEISDLEGISPIAQKWMLRNDLSSETMSAFYSLGVDEIDLVAKKVPGTSGRERLRNVLLLQGVASYLSGGVARIDKVKLKDSIAHYDADVGGNFSTYLKDWAAEISGSKAAGNLALTTRGLVSAKDLIKEMS